MKSNKTVGIAFALVFASFVLSTISSLVSLHVVMRDNVRTMNKVIAMRIYDNISYELSEPISVAKTMSCDIGLKEMLQNESEETTEMMTEYLHGLQEGLGYEMVFAISDASKTYYMGDGILKTLDYEHDEYDQWYPTFVQKNTWHDLDVDIDETGLEAWTVFVNARVQDYDDRLLGVCGVGILMTGLQKMFRGYEWDYGVKVRLVDTSGLVQVDSDEINIERTKLEDLNLSKDAKDDFVYQDAGDGSFVVTKYVENLKWFLVVQSNGVAESGQFANVIVVNVLLCLFVMAALVVFVQLTRRRANELENVSYKDQPTGLYNRRAFETDKDDMLNELLPEDFVYATVDINGLKTTNDTLGHAAGDELIVGAAQCLKECFGTYGRVYRIGGDEFAALLHVPPERLDALKEELAQTVGRWSGTRVQSLSVSCGYATQKEFPTQSLTELGKIADERMYADKTAYYERMNIERRRT